MLNTIHSKDHLELAVAEMLLDLKINFIHESQNNGSNLDFYLPDFDVFIEVKQFHADRVNKQLASKENVILIQGKKSIEMLNKLLSK